MTEVVLSPLSDHCAAAEPSTAKAKLSRGKMKMMDQISKNVS